MLGTRNKTLVTFSKDPAILHLLLGSLTPRKRAQPRQGEAAFIYSQARGKQPEPRSFRAFLCRLLFWENLYLSKCDAFL